MISRFSSRTQSLTQVFLKDRLKGAVTYDRISGYFRSSLFGLIEDELSAIGRVRLVCNADLDPRDLAVAGQSDANSERAQLDHFMNEGHEAPSLLDKQRWRRMHEVLSSGRVSVRVVSRQTAPFLHGKAGLLTYADGSTSAFMGSVNDSWSAWQDNYELLWEDRSREAADWVQAEFDWLWERGVPLAKAVIDEIGRESTKTEVPILKLRSEPISLIKAALVESPARMRGEALMPWQKSFVQIWNAHRETHGAARLILADEVGVGKTLSMAATGALSVLMGDGPFMILCPATLTQQWQVELYDKLGLPSARWTRVPEKGWVDHTGHLQRSRGPEDILACPCQIGIVSTGILTAQRNDKPLPEAEELFKGRFGMIALDEGHRARFQRGATEEEPRPGNLWKAMSILAARTRHLVIGTATPIQTHREEIWDLMKLLAMGREHVLGRPNTSHWYEVDEALNLISGRAQVETAQDAWDWLRSPLPAASEHQIFREIRRDLQLSKDISFTTASLADLDNFTRDELEDFIRKGDIGQKLPFLRYHNPLGRHVVLRRRKTLEDAGLMARVAVEIWPKSDQGGGIFQDSAVITPHFYDMAYEKVAEFTRTMAARVKANGFMKTLLLQRICSSVASGLSSARRMIEIREGLLAGGEVQEEEEGYEDLLGEMLQNEVGGSLDAEIARLQDVLELLDGEEVNDPKGRAVLHFLRDRGWLELGCIIFSQYYDTARWIADTISAAFPEEPVAVYAGLGRSGILLGGEWRSVEREEIKKLVKDGRVRVLTATDAAGEGLNLQTLGTLINVDLPWNPTRLEQRIGRIKRFGQKRRSVDMASLVYAGTIDERIYQRLSERMKDKFDILGSLPDVIEDEWIEDEKLVAEKMKTFTTPPSPADMFSLRYGNFLDSVDSDWETFEKFIARNEIHSVMGRPWP